MKGLATNLRLVDGRRNRQWKARVAELEAGSENFLVITRPDGGSVLALASALGMELARLAAPLTRFLSYRFQPYLTGPDTFALRSAVANGDFSYFIEQLRLPGTRPPHTGRHILYCEIRGVLQSCHSPDEARQALENYHRECVSGLRFPEPELFVWRGDRWLRDLPDPFLAPMKNWEAVTSSGSLAQKYY